MTSRLKSLVQSAPIFGIALLWAGNASAEQSDLTADTAINGPTLTFDWPAIEVGIGSYNEGPTGLTVIRFPKRASLVVDSRGGAPGTVNTDALRLGYSRPFADAVVFSGGSSYGEEAIAAVATGLKDGGVRSGDWRNIGFVAGAIIYDFGARRLNQIYPDKRLAQAALQAVRPGVFPLGAQGAGRMAMQGGFFGCDAHSGQGGAFRQIGSVKIAAFVVVNAVGAVTDRDGQLVSCNKPATWGGLTKVSELLQHIPASLSADWTAPGVSSEHEIPATKNTTISLIVTNQKLDASLLQRMAIQVHTSMARAIQPFSTASDGDTLYAASTQEVDSKDVSPEILATIGGETMWDAVLASVPAESVFVPPAKLPPVSADTLATYNGTYEFAVAPAQAVSPFSGLGLEVRIADGLPNITPVIGGPSAAAGVLRGDVITELDGASLQGLTLGQVVDKMRGPTGSRVELVVTRKDEAEPTHITVIRGPVRPRSLLQVQAQDGRITVEEIGGRQIYEFQSGRPIAVTALSNSEFFVQGRYHTRIAFTKDATGKVVGAVLNPGRWEQKGTKIS